MTHFPWVCIISWPMGNQGLSAPLSYFVYFVLSDKPLPPLSLLRWIWLWSRSRTSSITGTSCDWKPRGKVTMTSHQLRATRAPRLPGTQATKPNASRLHGRPAERQSTTTSGAPPTSSLAGGQCVTAASFRSIFQALMVTLFYWYMYIFKVSLLHQ